MQIHITRGEESSGPYTLEQVQDYLAQGILLPDDLAWHEGLDNWVPLAQLVTEAGTPQPPEAIPAPTQLQEANPCRYQFIKGDEKTYSSMQELINAYSVGQNVLGIFTSKKPSGGTTIESEELMFGRKLSTKERYLGTKAHLTIYLAFFVYVIEEMLFGLPFIVELAIAVAIAAVGMISAYFIYGVRKFPDILIITEHDLVLLTGIQWSTKDGLHKFGNGIRILRSHAKIKITHGKFKISVASAEKGLLGNQRNDVVVHLYKSSWFFPRKEKKVLGDQFVDLKQAKELLETSPAHSIST
jgi:hypothetical protein